MNEILEAAPDLEEALLLDPFGAQPHWASRISGLGGSEQAPDPSYVFLTHACRPAIGMVGARIRFFDLSISCGTLLIEVRVQSAVRGAEASRLQTIVVNADELAASDGIVELSFESYRNAHYAIACSINDETDLAASYVTVSIDRRATKAQHGREWEWSSYKEPPLQRPHGIEQALIRRSLTDLEAPRLETPMSQIASPQQCREPAFARTMESLHRPSTPTLENWSLAYVVQAINRYSSQTQCRMLGYGEHEAPLLSHFANQKCEVLGVRHVATPADRQDPGRELQKLWLPNLCNEADFFTHAHYTASDIRQTVDAFRDQFDVIWSIGANRLMTPQEYIYFVVNGLAHVRPGGLAVHVFDYIEDLDGDQRTNLTRHNVERMVLLAMAHSNEVARLRFRHAAIIPDRQTSLPFGVVMLRGGGQKS